MVVARIVLALVNVHAGVAVDQLEPVSTGALVRPGEIVADPVVTGIQVTFVDVLAEEVGVPSEPSMAGTPNRAM